MRRLSKVEEKAILKEALMYDEYLGNGSSRVVFSLGNGKVVKVANDVRGQYQNKVEIETFREHSRMYLAEIYAYGKYIVVAEKVQVNDDMEEVIDEYYYLTEDHEIKCLGEIDVFGYSGREAEQAVETKDFLDSVLGGTRDNYQIGLRYSDGSVVAYDYGYQPGSHDLSVSEELDYFLQECGYDYNAFLEYKISQFR